MVKSIKQKKSWGKNGIGMDKFRIGTDLELINWNWN